MGRAILFAATAAVLILLPLHGLASTRTLVPSKDSSIFEGVDYEYNNNGLGTTQRQYPFIFSLIDSATVAS